jgi:molybdopterin molybdotransferase
MADSASSIRRGPPEAAPEPLLPVEEAEGILAAFPLAVRAADTPLADALNRFLGRDILSPIDMPEFDKSAMDGYALMAGDDSRQFRIGETIAAGTPPSLPLARGRCARIMTGAMLPDGAGRVVRREYAEEADGLVRIVRQDPSDNVRRRGEDLRRGQPVLARGDRLTAARVALLAALGMAVVPVARPPRIGVITTGSELVAPGSPLAPGRIYDSNSYSLAAQLREAGAEPVLLPGVADEAAATARAIAGGLDDCDALILSGGVSAGDFDYVPAAMKDAGCAVHFRRVAVQPGMPTVFASRDGKPVFGLPGNPVSTFVIFEVFIKPLLLRWQGHDFQPPLQPAELQPGFRRARSERTAFLPVACRSGRAELLAYHGSAHLHALSRANALLRVPAGVNEIPAGSIVDVRLL